MPAPPIRGWARTGDESPPRLVLTCDKRPKHIEFHDDLPKTNAGTILRRALRAPTRSFRTPDDHMNPPPISEVLATAGVTVFERGWLSANNVLIQGNGPSALIDSGYCTHAEQTLALVRQGMSGRSLDLLLNTHLHSDHCGGNAALQNAYPELKTLIPPGQAKSVAAWDPVALTHTPTGQECPYFEFQGLLQPGTSIQLGSKVWSVLGAKGHDPHSIVLHQPESRLLISADALWQNGFGVVFPELEGLNAFDEVGETLDLIEALNAQTVIPGHGSVFQDVGPAIQRARTRLAQFRGSPDKHRRHAVKVLIKFRLLAWQRIQRVDLQAWVEATPYLLNARPQSEEMGAWLGGILHELERSGALYQLDDMVMNRP